jgi:hypothetical protein
MSLNYRSFPAAKFQLHFPLPFRPPPFPTACNGDTEAQAHDNDVTRREAHERDRHELARFRRERTRRQVTHARCFHARRRHQHRQREQSAPTQASSAYSCYLLGLIC